MKRFHPRDPLDWEVIEILRADGRTTNKEIAQRLAISEVNVAARIKWLRAHKVMAVTLQRDIYSQGFQHQCIVDVYVRGRPPSAVGAAIAALDGVLAVNLLVGKPQIIATCNVRGREDMFELIYVSISAIRGVERVAVHTTLEIHKYESTYGDLSRE